MSGPFAFQPRQTMSLDQLLNSVPTMDGLRDMFAPAGVRDNFDPGDDMKMVIAAFYETAQGRQIIDWLLDLTCRAPYPHVGVTLEAAGIAAAKHEARAAVGYSLLHAIAQGKELFNRRSHQDENTA